MIECEDEAGKMLVGSESMLGNEISSMKNVSSRLSRLWFILSLVVDNGFHQDLL